MNRMMCGDDEEFWEAMHKCIKNDGRSKIVLRSFCSIAFLTTTEWRSRKKFPFYEISCAMSLSYLYLAFIA